MTITPEQRDELRALDAEATPGPWRADECLPAFPGQFAVVTPREENAPYADQPAQYVTPWGLTGTDAALIAASRTALPALLDALDQAERERGEWEQAAMKLAESSNAANADLHDAQDALDRAERERDEARATKDMHKERAERIVRDGEAAIAAVERVRVMLDRWEARGLTAPPEILAALDGGGES